MSAFLESLKSDLLDRRLLPFLGIVGVALLAAIAYATLAGSGSSTPSPGAVATPPGNASGVAVTAVTTTGAQPVAETTSGSGQQTGGHSRNPFAPLPGVKQTNPAAASTSSSSSVSAPATSSAAAPEAQASSGSGSGAGSPSTSSRGGSAPSQQNGSSQGKRKSVYDVEVLFGTAAPGTPLQSAQLPSYKDLARQQPLPSAKQPLVVFRGVIAGGKSATFTLVGEAILRGSASCLPSASQCQAVDLKVGQTEELEYVPLGGTAVTYQLHLVSIKASKAATGSAARHGTARESKSGLALLRNAGLLTLPGLRNSRAKGVLVFASARALAARAHVAVWGAAFGR
jgi:hypothetical protein